MPDTPDAYEKAAEEIAEVISDAIAGAMNSVAATFIGEDELNRIGRCQPSKLPSEILQPIIALLRENIPTSASDPDATYPLKAAEMMADKMAAHVGCVKVLWGSKKCDFEEKEEKACYACWLQYFRERAEEGKK